MTIVNVPENRKAEMFQEFYDTSCFTFEGLNVDKTFKTEFEKIARASGFKEKEMIAYRYSGKDMNEVFEYSGPVAYSDDLTFISIPNYYNPIVKMEVGARWFDDIISNNNIRMKSVLTGLEPDYA